jgi:hypothetical protein
LLKAEEKGAIVEHDELVIVLGDGCMEYQGAWKMRWRDYVPIPAQIGSVGFWYAVRANGDQRSPAVVSVAGGLTQHVRGLRVIDTTARNDSATLCRDTAWDESLRAILKSDAKVRLVGVLKGYLLLDLADVDGGHV